MPTFRPLWCALRASRPSGKSESSSGAPLQVVLVFLFLVQVVSVVGLTSWLSLRNGERAVEDLAQQLMERISHRVEEHLDEYLAAPVKVNAENRRAIELGLLNKNWDLQQRHFWSQIKSHPDLGYVSFSHADGRFLGVGRWFNRRFVVTDEILPTRLGYSTTSAMSNDTGQKLHLIQEDRNEPREADWYQSAVQAKRQTWTITTEGGLTQNTKFWTHIAATLNQPIYDNQQKLLGVLSADLMLSGISEWLRSVEVSPDSEIFIFDRQGLLVGSSTTEPIVQTLENGQLGRTSLDSASSPTLQQIAQLAQEQSGASEGTRLKNLVDQETLTLLHDEEPILTRLTAWQDNNGLELIVAIAIPKSDFTARIEAHTQQTILLCGGALLLSTALGLYTSRKIAASLGQLHQRTLALASGDWHSSVHRSGIQEFNELAEAFNQMGKQLNESFSTLNYQAHHDSLTGLLNRKTFRELLQIELKAQTALGEEAELFALLFLDLDYFKLVNDSLGHLVGDQLLLHVCKRLEACIREGDCLGRFGGDEFVILLRSLSGSAQAVEIAERIIDSLQCSFILEGNEIFIDTSIGIVLGAPEHDADTLLRSADAALYRAKANGRGRYEVFDHQMHADVVHRLQLETELRWAIERQEFEIYYQPIVEISSRKIQGFEALLRWNHSARGWISPVEFIPIAEETGLIIKIGQWVLEQSCQQLKSWQQMLPSGQELFISVNVSSKQFLQTDFLYRVQEVLQKTSLPPQQLKLEITESLLMNHEDTIKARLQFLNELGIQFSIDDFGTGYSSLNYLHRFPIRTLKIDRSFIQDLETDSKHLSIVETILELARRMNLNVIAEGVETETQLQCLQSLNCEVVQGFLFSKPLTTHQIMIVLHECDGLPTLSPDTSPIRSPETSSKTSPDTSPNSATPWQSHDVSP